VNRSSLHAGFFLAAITLATVPAHAGPEIREPTARVAIDLPNGWIPIACSHACAAAPDKHFNVRLIGTTHVAKELEADEDWLLKNVVAAHMSNYKVDKRAQRVEWDSFGGSELSGTGRYMDADWRFTAYSLIDRKDKTRAVAMLVLGADSQWPRDFPALLVSLKKMRPY
jgi:hypothetical protein